MKLLYTDEVESSLSPNFFNILIKAVMDKIEVDCSDECEVSLLITDDESIRGLNKDFRGIDRATDVLSVNVITTSLIDFRVLLSAGFAVNAASICTGSTFST